MKAPTAAAILLGSAVLLFACADPRTTGRDHEPDDIAGAGCLEVGEVTAEACRPESLLPEVVVVGIRADDESNSREFTGASSLARTSTRDSEHGIGN